MPGFRGSGVEWRMTILPEAADGKPPAGAALAFRHLHGSNLMVMNKLRGAAPETDELCRIRAVETLATSLWVTATFLDGSTRGFPSSSIRPATSEENVASKELHVPGGAH